MSLGFDEVMAALDAAGCHQTSRTYLRHGAREPLFGVKCGELRPMAKRIGTAHALARRLWTTGNADARFLACMVADPSAFSNDELDVWLEDIDSYFLVDVFVAEVAAQAPGRGARAERWIASGRDSTAQAGWDLMDLLALSDEQVPGGYFEAQLHQIEERIGGYGNWTRRSASNTITGIGLRIDALEAAARRTATEMGPVDFDPGQTSCVRPDPIAYLEKTKAHRARQAQKRAARSRS